MMTDDKGSSAVAGSEIACRTSDPLEPASSGVVVPRLFFGLISHRVCLFRAFFQPLPVSHPFFFSPWNSWPSGQENLGSTSVRTGRTPFGSIDTGLLTRLGKRGPFRDVQVWDMACWLIHIEWQWALISDLPIFMPSKRNKKTQASVGKFVAKIPTRPDKPNTTSLVPELIFSRERSKVNLHAPRCASPALVG